MNPEFPLLPSFIVDNLSSDHFMPAIFVEAVFEKQLTYTFSIRKLANRVTKMAQFKLQVSSKICVREKSAKNFKILAKY